MKKQLLLALLIVAGLAAVLAFKQENTPKKYLTLTILISHGMTIVDEQGTKQTIKLDPYKNFEQWVENVQAPLTTQLNELAAKGYKLIAVSPTFGGSNATYIFEKE